MRHLNNQRQNQGSGGSLQRSLSPMHVWAIAFGCVIGWGSFINPGKKFLPNSGVAGTAIAMILGALVMIIIAFSYAYMVPKFPSAGGEFSFAKNCFGKKKQANNQTHTKPGLISLFHAILIQLRGSPLRS